MAGCSHYDWSGNFSKVIGSEGSPTYVKADQLPFGKSAMLFSGGADHPVAPFHFDNFGLSCLHLSLR